MPFHSLDVITHAVSHSVYLVATFHSNSLFCAPDSCSYEQALFQTRILFLSSYWASLPGVVVFLHMEF